MVSGEGSLPALGLVIASSPGRQEVYDGKPFVGTPGKLLRIALEVLGVTDETYLTYLVKEELLNDNGTGRNPYPYEVESWLPVLQSEVEACCPAGVLLLGKSTRSAFLGDHDEWGKLPITPDTWAAWSPSYIARAGAAPEHWGLWLKQLEPWADHVLKVRNAL